MVFTQPGSICEVTERRGHVRFDADSGSMIPAPDGKFVPLISSTLSEFQYEIPLDRLPSLIRIRLPWRDCLVVLGSELAVIGAEGAIAPATCFSRRLANSRLNPVLQLSTSIVGTVMLEGRFREGIRVDDRRPADGARTGRFQGVRPAFHPPRRPAY